MRILITGATGFVGGHLAERLIKEGGHELHGWSRQGRWSSDLAHLAESVRLQAVDLIQPDSIANALAAIRPDWIFHLAGYANTGGSYREPLEAWRGNLDATIHLYEAISRVELKTRVLFASTGLVYGTPASGQHAHVETDLLQPANPYAASKAAADLLSYQVTRHPGLDVVRVRCFNQFGPRQSPDFATANFARQIAAIEKGSQPPLLETGDLSGRRDLTDVRDMVRSLIALMNVGQSGEVYNAGSGTTHSMRTVLNQMLAMARVRIEVRERAEPNRRQDASASWADVGKLRAATGWHPEYPLDVTLADLLNYWRQRAA